MPKVFVTRSIPEQGLDILRTVAEVKVWEGELPPPRHVLIQEVQDCDALIPLLTDRIDGELLDRAPGLKVVANYAVGYDNIDVASATARGVLVTNTPGVLTETTADLAFALILAAGRRVVEADKFTRAGKWKTWGPTLLLGQDVYGATLGLVGLGRIGTAVARRACGFNMKILYYSRRRQEGLEKELGVEYVSFAELLRRSDFISIHVPLSQETHHLFDSAAFAQMKPTAVLVNTARGPIVDETALYEALKSGRIAAAGLDVMDPEPPCPDNPLLTLDNVILLPHIGSASVATRTRMATMAAENGVAALRGELPPNLVNKEVWAIRRR
ncbi:MAG: D-glycerate dehydrogenase [Firmicutes bacterium]|nr:D-glycerate dehydrogenase [Bacillota bacterium]